jgi:hypothetical protein
MIGQRRLTTSMLATALLLAARPAAAQLDLLEPPAPPRALLGFSVDLSGFGLRHDDAGYDLMSRRDDRSAGGLEASYDAVRWGRASRLGLGLGFVHETVGPSADYDNLRPSFAATSFYAVAVARWRQDRLVQPYVTLAGGLTQADLHVQSLHGHATGGHGRAGVGLRFMPQILVIKHRGQPVLGFTFTAEAGGVLGSKLAFDLAPDGFDLAPGAPPGDTPIAADSVRAGNLDPRAVYGRLGVGLVF